MITTDHPIIRMGTLFFIAVDEPKPGTDVRDFSDEHSETFGDAIIVDDSTRDPFMMLDDQHYIVVQIPFFRNGEQLDTDDVIAGQLARTLGYLHQKGLRSSPLFPGLVVRKLFAFDLQAAR